MIQCFHSFFFLQFYFQLKKSDYDDGGATIEELNEALEEVAYANQQELL